MTYAEIAVAFGIGQDSARNLVRRKRWNRKPGNDGLARIDVPVEYLDQAAARPSAVYPIHIRASAPTDGGRHSAASDLALSVLKQHIERCETEIDALKRELDAARRRASERDVAAAELATFSVVLGELRSERKYWRDQAERLSLALTSASQRSRLSWLSLRFGRNPVFPADTGKADQGMRSAREAAQDAGLLPSVTDTPKAAEKVQPLCTSPAQVSTSLLHKDSPPLTASDLERALERLNEEIESRPLPAGASVAA